MYFTALSSTARLRQSLHPQFDARARSVPPESDLSSKVSQDEKPVSDSYPQDRNTTAPSFTLPTAHRPPVGRSAERSGCRRRPRGRSYRFE